MATRVLIPTALRAYAGGKSEVLVKAKTVEEALGHVTKEYRDLRKHLYTEQGTLRNFVNVYVNGEDIRYMQQVKTPLKEGDTLTIVPSIAGGSQRATAAAYRWFEGDRAACCFQQAERFWIDETREAHQPGN